MTLRRGALRYFATIKNGTTPASGDPSYWDGDILWATPDDLGRLSGSHIGQTKRSVTALAVADYNLSVVPSDTILMSTRAPIGHIGITSAPMAFNQGCRALIPNSEAWGPYLLFLLKARVPELNASANGTTFVELSRDELASVLITLPPLDQQKRISAFLDEKTAQIDGLIAKKQALLERLAEKRQAIITQAVTKGLNPAATMKDSGIEWLGPMPAHWRVKCLRYVTENLNHRRIPIAAELRKGIDQLYPYYGASGVIDFVDDYIFDFPTILVAEDGANLESVQDHYELRQSRRSMSLTDAHRRNASAFWFRHSQSLLSRRQRLSQAMVRSTIQRLGRTTNLPLSQRRTISTFTARQARARPVWNFGP